ncbi:MAG: HAMP domain-containing protein [Elusimicrobia bacterium]|nr:HAMP domain-containing protein [Elusimicrobiota bacterium]
MKIRAKFSLFSSLLVVLLTLGISSAVFILERRNLVANLNREQMVQTKNFAAVCQQAMTISDMLFLDNYLKVLRTQAGLEWAYLMDPRGRILAHTDGRFLYKLVGEWRQQEGEKNVLEIREPVRLRDQIRGYATLGYSREAMDREIQKSVAQTIRWIGMLAFLGIFLGLSGAWVMAHFMARPIRDLAEGSREIGRGNLGVNLPVRSRDELGDLTDQFNRMARQLKELDELKDQFISMVSHDLRSPLAAITMHVDYLLSGARGELNLEQADMLKICVEASARLGVFINNLLDSAKIKAGKMKYHFASFNLGDALGKVTELIKISAEQKNIKMRVQDWSNAPPLWGDRERIEQVFSNLISNAIKHTPERGHIQVGWGLEADSGRMITPPVGEANQASSGRSTGGVMKVMVANTGSVIPPEDLPHLFDRFYQADLKKQKEAGIKGTGLGLFIVKQTIDAHQGKIWIESDAARGVRFYFTLPLAQKEESAHPSPFSSPLVGERGG